MSADKRADIWAFGVVLYEMLTGRRAFEGEDVSSIMAAVIQSEPRWDGVPASVRRLLESCLKKIRRSGCAISATSGSYSMTSRQSPHERRPASLAGQPQALLALAGGGGAVGALARDADSCRAASPAA